MTAFNCYFTDFHFRSLFHYILPKLFIKRDGLASSLYLYDSPFFFPQRGITGALLIFTERKHIFILRDGEILLGIDVKALRGILSFMEKYYY
jgi:hypothetical protein